ncbi:MAG: PAS domain S-box protein, partial [Planctomycetota bacterium]
MSSDDADAAKLRAELAQAQAGLATAGHNQASFLRILECAELSVDDRLQVTFSRNGEQIFESCNTPCAVLDLFTESAEARRYFEWIFDQREVMRAQAKAAESMPWDQIFPSPRRREDSLLRFHPLPAQDWEVTADSALTRGPTNPLGAYLMSHRQLLAADQDFRIEYEATAGPEPGDLSLVVGGAADDGIFNQQAPLPEDRGYCFAFGGNANTVSELQRFRRSMAASATVLEPGRTYRCAAERVGGRLRFYVDGAVLYEYIDILPLLGDGHGYVGLYTWGAGQRFANLRVASRPTCLSQEQRRQIAAYRAPVLEARSATPRYVEVRLVGTRTGQPRTTYQLLARDSTAAILESHRRRDAERASNFEAERLAVTLRSIGDGIITTDIHGLVTLMNHSAEVLTGWTQAEALGKPLTKVFHIIRATRLGGPDERGVGVLLDGKAAVILGDDATLTMVARDGTRRFIQRTAASIQDATGRALGTVLIFRDVTAQHRADEARAQLAAIVESSEDAIIGKSLDGRIVSWNAGAERMLGYTAAEVIGRSGEFLLAQGAPHETTEMTQRVATAQTAEHYETVYLTRDLKPIHVALTKSVIRDAAGLLSGVSTIARDIGERIRTEAALRESEERYALAARGANDGLWDWNLKSGQVYFSARFKAMLGLGENELASTMEAWYALIDPADVDALRNAIAAHAARRTSQLEVEHRMFHADGSVRWMLTRAMGVFDESGQATRIAGSLTDVTDRKAAEEQFRHDALHDQLTGLPNRALFADRLGHALQRMRRNKDYHFAVMFLDLDRFKRVNDS